MTTRAVRVVTEVAALDRSFDYAVTNATSHVGVGDRVRVNLHGRSVRGWVWEFVDSDRELKPLTKWLGLGVPESELPLLSWASRRWNAPVARFLLAGSPTKIVPVVPERPTSVALEDSVAAAALRIDPGAIRLAPTVDPLALVLHAYETTRAREGSLIVLLPTEAWAQRMAGRLAQRGCAVALAHEWDKMRAGWPVIVGARGIAFAPTPLVGGAVVIDADDEAYRSEASPTWHAVDVLRERCELSNSPLWVTSPVLSPTLRHNFSSQLVVPGETANWPAIEVVDRRRSDPRDGVLSGPALTAARQALAGDEAVAVVVILQRLGKGRLFACKSCGQLATCSQCALAEVEIDGRLECPTHREAREMFCRNCGATALRTLRSGVSTLARDVSAQLSQVVTEITSASDLHVATNRVVVGTEAIWQRVRRAGVVIFADFDQYLLAPRERSRRDAVLAVAKAGRLVGARSDGRGRVVLQTRRGGDSVLRALEIVDFTDLCSEDDELARVLELPPFVATATISGDAAEQFVADLASDSVRVVVTEDGYVAHAATVEVLTDRLAATERPPGRLRVAVN